MASKTPTTSDQWQTLDRETALIRGVWYGDPGTRKTTGIATMAELGPVLYIDTEQGLKHRPLEAHGVPTANIRPVRDASYTHMEDLIAKLRAEVDAGTLDIVGVVLDSITAATSYLLQDLVAAQVRKAQRSGQERQAWKIFRDDYGDMTAQMRNIYRGFRDLPVHLAIAAHTRRDQDEEGSVRVGPAVGPALQNDLIGYSDIVIKTGITNDEEPFGYGITKPTGRFEAKDRFDVLPTSMADPTFIRVHQYVTGVLTADTDPIQDAARKRRNSATQPTTTTKEA